jgi:DNA ligase-1
MQRRETVMLAKSFDPSKHSIGGQMMSEKLDGQRIIWDGGISNGVLATEVPWAYNPKAGQIATGLWSRNFKVVHAPKNWIEEWCPKGIPLDGEGYMGSGQFQETESILRTETPDVERWKQIKYMVFDSPPIEYLFGEGYVNIFGKKHTIPNCLNWIVMHGGAINRPYPFEQIYNTLPIRSRVEQTRLPLSEAEAREVMYKKLNEVSEAGGEGLMIRKLSSYWCTKRTDDLLKVKKFYESTAEVIGYTDGLGRLAGMTGALVVKDKGIVFELAGLTDDERSKAKEKFPVGTVVRYKYNDTTNDNVPKHARYWR